MLSILQTIKISLDGHESINEVQAQALMESALKSEEAITARVKEAEELWERIKIALEIPEGQQAAGKRMFEARYSRDIDPSDVKIPWRDWTDTLHCSVDDQTVISIETATTDGLFPSSHAVGRRAVTIIYPGEGSIVRGAEYRAPSTFSIQRSTGCMSFPAMTLC